MKLITLMAILVSLLALARSASPDRVLFINADIHTMDRSNSRSSAMLVVAGVIQAVGLSEVLRETAPPGTRVVDVGGRVMFPGFVDAHSHFPASHLRRAGLDLSAPPVGTVSDLQTLLSRVEASTMLRDEGKLILGFNYDNALIDEGRHPTRVELDAVSPDHPVWLAHSSGHMGVANSLALERFGREVSGNGLLQESDAPVLSSLVSDLPLGRLLRVLFDARDAYLAAGVTTVQNGHASRSAAWLLRITQAIGVLPQRVIIWPANDHLGDELLNDASRSPFLLPASSDSYHTGAVKLIVDGSPQGLTAWLSTPYPPSAGKPDDYTGIPVIDAENLNRLVSDYHQAGYQLALHGNGDAAIDAILDAVERAIEEKTEKERTGKNGTDQGRLKGESGEAVDPRHFIVHAQTLRKDQTVRMRALNVSASFFPAHTFYWGTWHEEVALGPVRAANISPLAWADAAGVRYTLHADSPVTPMQPMQMVWSATKRETLQGRVLGPDLRISRTRAFRAITIDAAWQNHMERFSGSLEPGKRADFIVLDGDPMTAEDVRDVRVDETWIDGVREYAASTHVE